MTEFDSIVDALRLLLVLTSSFVFFAETTGQISDTIDDIESFRHACMEDTLSD